MSARRNLIPMLLYALMGAGLLYLNMLVFRAGHVFFGVLLLGGLSLAAYIYASQRMYCYRYLFPSLLAFLLFVLLPLGYTVYIAFTNYSALNMMTYGELRENLKRERLVEVNAAWAFHVHAAPQKDQYVLVLAPPPGTGLEPHYATEPFPGYARGDRSLTLRPVDPADLADPLDMRQTIALRHALKSLVIAPPREGPPLRLYSFRAFAPTRFVWQPRQASECMVHIETGQVITPDFETGFFRDAEGQPVGPGFRVRIGWDNFARIFTNEAVRGPFLVVFTWTLTFALLSVLLTFAAGFLLAVLLEWKPLRGRHIWRSLVILPYAVPAFISILIFRGLFNPQFGDINAMLNALFGIRPEWTTHPTLARTMVLLVNLWLGYPYMMILCTGILQSVPGDIYEASAIDGGTPFSDLYKITLPLIFPPLKPLLIASFAFNFNNFLLIQLLTGGSPRIPDAATAVGYTDILVTYTFNLAFRDAGANFGFASAIATIIFIIVSLLSYINLRTSMRNR